MMKSFFSIVLVALALWCCTAESHNPCPNVVGTMGGFLIEEDSVYRKYISQFGAPNEAVEALMTVKSCVNQISLPERMLIEDVLGNTVAACMNGE